MPNAEEVDVSVPNPVIQLLQGLLAQGDQLQIEVPRSKMLAFTDPQLPTKSGVRFVKSQLDALLEEEASATQEPNTTGS